MHVESLHEYAGKVDDCLALGKMLGKVIGMLRSGQESSAVLQEIDDTLRFNKEAKDAYYQHVVDNI